MDTIQKQFQGFESPTAYLHSLIFSITNVELPKQPEIQMFGREKS